ncbi:MAG TPA: hypothetical protein GXZ28_11435, partial [Clostridiales bacterium]|nr:hypothetical protein [Clostridiales bacterium]
MHDNEIHKSNNKILDRGNSSIQFLYSLANEIKEELYLLSKEEKECTINLEENNKKLKEIERVQNYNKNLFSPVRPNQREND